MILKTKVCGQTSIIIIQGLDNKKTVASKKCNCPIQRILFISVKKISILSYPIHIKGMAIEFHIVHAAIKLGDIRISGQGPGAGGVQAQLQG